MKPFKINSTTYFLPESWSEVTLGQYQRYHAAQQDKELGSLDKAARILHIFSSMPLEEIEEAGTQLIIPLLASLSFLKLAIEADPVEHFVLKGETYYVNVLTKFGELAAYDRVVSSFKGDMLAAAPYLLAILCRKRGEAFLQDKQELTKRAKLFELELDAPTVIGLVAFFLNREQVSQLGSQFSSRVAAAQQKLRESLAATSMSGTDGGPRPSIWLRLYFRLVKFLTSRSIPSWSTSNTIKS